MNAKFYRLTVDEENSAEEFWSGPGRGLWDELTEIDGEKFATEEQLVKLQEAPGWTDEGAPKYALTPICWTEVKFYGIFGGKTADGSLLPHAVGIGSTVGEAAQRAAKELEENIILGISALEEEEEFTEFEISLEDYVRIQKHGI